MADSSVKISELVAASSVDGTEVVPGVQSSTTKKIALSTIVNSPLVQRGVKPAQFLADNLLGEEIATSGWALGHVYPDGSVIPGATDEAVSDAVSLTGIGGITVAPLDSTIYQWMAHYYASDSSYIQAETHDGSDGDVVLTIPSTAASVRFSIIPVQNGYIDDPGAAGCLIFPYQPDGRVPALETTVSALSTDKAPLASPAFTGTPTAPNPADNDDSQQIATTHFVAETAEALEDTKAPVITETASGEIVTFADGADGLPVQSLVANIEPVQAGSGDPAPDNVRPITGWTNARAVRTGVNSCPPLTIGIGLASGSGVETQSDTSATSDYIPVNFEKNGSYAISGLLNTLHSFICGYDDNKVFTGRSSGSNRIGLVVNESVLTAGTIASTKPTRYLRVTQYVSGEDSGVISDITNAQIMGAISETAALTYVPYAGNEVVITDWSGVVTGGTVYHGNVDVTTGVLTVDYGMVDLGDLTYTYNNTEQSFAYFQSNEISTKAAGSANIIASCYKTVAAGRQNLNADGTITSYNATTNRSVAIRNDAYSDPAAFQTAMSGQTMIFLLAAPLTYQLTPQEVATLLGNNTIYADTGSVDVTYCADTGLFIAQRVPDAPAADGTYVLKATVASGTVTYGWVSE